MIFRDYCLRICRQICGDVEWIMIPRHRCSNEKCHKIHRMLPDFLAPFKHYQEEVIVDSIDDRLSPDEVDDSPSSQTVKRWKTWMDINTTNIDGHLKSIGYRELGFSEELMRSSISLLKELRSSIPQGWLKTILRMIYNTGARLWPFYG